MKTEPRAFTCFECKREVALPLDEARDTGWFHVTGAGKDFEVCPACAVELGYRSAARAEAQRDWYRRRRALSSFVFTMTCDRCGATADETHAELKRLGWKKRWKSDARGLQREEDLCPSCVIDARGDGTMKTRAASEKREAR